MSKLFLRTIFLVSMAWALMAQPANAQVPLSCGQLATGTLTAGERDHFTFVADAGDVVTFMLVDAGDIDPGFLPSIRATRPGGTVQLGFGTNLSAISLPESGTYTLEVFDFSGLRGNYALRLWWALPLNKQCGDRTTLSCGQVASGSIASPLEQDFFLFSGQQGSVVSLELVQTGGSGLPAGFRLDAAGSVLGTLVRNFPSLPPAPLVFTLPTTGTYVVVVHDFVYTGTSTYAFRFGSATPCPTGSPPGPPSNLAASVVGATVTLTWGPASGAVSSYVLEAGSAPGGVDVTVFDTGSTLTSLTAGAVPPGMYFVRVKGRSGTAIGPPSNEVAFSVGGGAGPCTAAPLAPGGLSSSVNGSNVTLAWTGSGGGVSTYIVLAGSVSGASNLANFATGNANTGLNATAPPGRYFVRVIAQSACGVSAASNEIVVTVQ